MSAPVVPVRCCMLAVASNVTSAKHPIPSPTEEAAILVTV